MIAVEHVDALLDPESVIAACGIDARHRGHAWRLRTCPGCGARPARAGAAIYQRDERWRWTHHGHDCGGSLLDLVAAAERIDRRREFTRLLERGAQIAGIVETGGDLTQRVAAQVAANRARSEQESRERVAAIEAMPALWDSLHRKSSTGEHYLLGRGLDPSELVDVVRYTPSGEVAVAIRNLETGVIVGIQYRAPQAKGFRSAVHSATDEGALHGRIAELDRQGVDVAVVVEGLADTLAARLAFPGCAVFGAAGAAQLETITAAVADRIHEIRGYLLLVIDDDDPGVEAGVDAIKAADKLELDRDLLLVDLGEHHDLADAWAAGWRWTWAS